MKKFWVYIHTCPNGKKYVGVTGRDPESRWLKGRGYCQNKHFYSAILKYGWDNITHEVFEVDSEEEMYRKEVELISFYHSNDPNFGYNHSTGGERSSLGCKHSEEYRKKMSEAHKKRWADPGFREKVVEAQKKVRSDPEYRKKLSEANRKKGLNPEYREKLSKAHKGLIRSEEARKHIAEAAKKRANDPEYRKKLSERRKGKTMSEETKRKLSEINKNRPRISIKLPDGTVLEMTKQNLTRNYIKKGKKFEYLS